MYKVCFYVPDSHVELVKQAIFKVGAGKIGNYADCCWQVLGKGQFKPLIGSNPFLGEMNEVEYVEEWRVELVVLDELISQVVATLKANHPYETPAYDVIKIANF